MLRSPRTYHSASARNSSMFQKAKSAVESTLRQADPYTRYKKHDDFKRTQKFVPAGWQPSKPSFAFGSKQLRRMMLDRPWLLPAVVGGSLLATVVIILLSLFSHSAQHEQVPQWMEPVPASYDHHYTHSSHSSQHNTARSAPDDHDVLRRREQSLEKSVDSVLELFRKSDSKRWNAANGLANRFCVEKAGFYLESDEALHSLFGNVGVLFSDISSFTSIHSAASPKDVVLTAQGTFVAQGDAKGRWSKCSLVTTLFSRADNLGLLQAATPKEHDFDMDSQQFWKQHSKDVHSSTKQLNQDVLTLMGFAADNKYYEVSMELPAMFDAHCPDAKQWLKTKDKGAMGVMMSQLTKAMFELNAPEDMDNIDGYPVIDEHGNLMQLEVDKDNFEIDDKLRSVEDDYVRCPLLDRILLYQPAMDIDKHVDLMTTSVVSNDYYAFQVMTEMLETKYCPAVESQLTLTARAHLNKNLWLFMKDISKERSVGNHDNFVINRNGGLVHKDQGGADGIQCELINHVARRAKDGKQVNTYDEFGNANSDGDVHLVPRKAGNAKQLKEDAQKLVDHLKNGEDAAFEKLVGYLLELHHADWFKELGEFKANEIKIEIEDSIRNAVLKTKKLTKEFDPEKFMVVHRRDSNIMEIIEIAEFAALHKETIAELERLPLFDAVLKIVYE